MADFKYECKDLEVMSSAHKYHAWILSKFRRFLGKRVAEVGAGSGNFFSLLMREPVEKLVAVEPSEEAYQMLKQKTDGDSRVSCHNAFFSEASEQYNNYFDSVIYVDVLEHINDDSAELSHVYKSLKKGGYVCVFVPALPWLYSYHDKSIGHFRRYHKKQLRDLLDETGFEVISLHYFDIVGIVTWLIMFKFLNQKPNPGNIGFYDKYIVPFSRFIEYWIPPPIGKNLVIIGQKSL